MVMVTGGQLYSAALVPFVFGQCLQEVWGNEIELKWNTTGRISRILKDPASLWPVIAIWILRILSLIFSVGIYEYCLGPLANTKPADWAGEF